MAKDRETLRKDLRKAKETLNQYEHVIEALKDTDVDDVQLMRKINRLKVAVNATEEAIKRMP